MSYFLDLDEVYATAVVRTQAKVSGTMTKILKNDCGVEFTHQLYTTSLSGNAHLYVHLSERMSYEERMVLQACLGSDPVREIYNLTRHRNSANHTQPYCMALFETQDQALLVWKWRITVAAEIGRKRLKVARQEQAPMDCAF